MHYNTITVHTRCTCINVRHYDEPVPDMIVSVADSGYRTPVQSLRLVICSFVHTPMTVLCLMQLGFLDKVSIARHRNFSLLFITQ